MELIKKTTSLSPLTNREVDAEIYREDNCVYMIKKDEQGKEYKHLVERDYDMYRVLTSMSAKEDCCLSSIFLYITSKCNLKCPLCYESSNPGSTDMTTDELRRYIADYEGAHFVLAGREPAMRDDINEIIKIIAEKNHVSILTNGLQFADYDFVLKLKKSGLQTCIFQFYGFDDEIYVKMNGMATLQKKLQGLENCKKLNIPTLLSLTIAKGINEGEVKKIYDYILKNRSFIYDYRIRSVAPIGNYLDTDQLFISDLVNLVAESLNFNRQHLLNEHQLLNEVSRYFKIDFLRPRVCTFSFYVKHEKNGESFPVGKNIDMEKFRKSRFKRLYLLLSIIRCYGLFFIFQNYIVKKMVLKPIILKNFTRFSLRSWPSIYNIDMEEMQKCSTGYCRNTGEKNLKFCYSNIIEGSLSEDKNRES